MAYDRTAVQLLLTTMASPTFQSSPDSGPLELLDLNSASEPISHPTLWYDDGSVVLQAETTMFRVHRSILSAQSEIFKDMFAIPQSPTSTDGTVDGCPVITMLGDTMQDWENTYSACDLHQNMQTVSFEKL